MITPNPWTSPRTLMGSVPQVGVASWVSISAPLLKLSPQTSEGSLSFVKSETVVEKFLWMNVLHSYSKRNQQSISGTKFPGKQNNTGLTGRWDLAWRLGESKSLVWTEAQGAADVHSCSSSCLMSLSRMHSPVVTNYKRWVILQNVLKSRSPNLHLPLFNIGCYFGPGFC